MAVAPPPGWLAAAVFVAAVQLAAAVRLYLRSRRRAPALQGAPSACVIVPFKGPASAENVAAFLKQDYPGELSWKFVVASDKDAALSVLPAAHRLVSGAVPTVSSEKSLNLAAGAAAAGGAELLLFADADVRVRPDWARRLAAALQEPGATVATAALLPRDWLSAAWFSAGLTWFEPLTIAVGQSLAIRRRDFDALGVAERWQSAVSDDLALANAVRAAGGRCVLVPGAAPEGRGGGFSAALEQFDRWMTLFRFDMPRVWWPGLLAVAVKLGALWQAFSAPFCPALAAVVLGGDALTLFVAACALGSPRRAAGVALAAPLLLAAHARNYLVSAFQREIVWAGWTYFLDGPRAERGTVPALYARRRRLLRLLFCALGATLAGWSFAGASWGALAWLGFVPLLLLVEDEKPAAAFAWGLLYGVIRWCAGLPWMHGFIAGFLHTGPPETAVWTLGVAATQALRWGLCAGLAAFAPRAWRGGAFAALALAAEAFWPALLPEPLAYTQLHVPAFVAWGRLTVAECVLACNALLAARRPWSVALAALLAGIGLTRSLPTWREPTRALSFAAVQGRDWSPTAELRAELVVWPEGAYKGELVRLPKPAADTLLTAHDGGKNVAVLLQTDGSISIAQKEVLVPFGEYMPRFLSFLRRVSPRTGTLTPGAPSKPLQLPTGALAGTLICYENLAPGRARRLVSQGADFLVTQASSSWTPDRRAAEMHARFSALRAIETRRAVLHVADRGPTVLYAPDGRELDRQNAIMRGRIPLPERR